MKSTYTTRSPALNHLLPATEERVKLALKYVLSHRSLYMQVAKPKFVLRTGAMNRNYRSIGTRCVRVAKVLVFRPEEVNPLAANSGESREDTKQLYLIHIIIPYNQGSLSFVTVSSSR